MIIKVGLNSWVYNITDENVVITDNGEVVVYTEFGKQAKLKMFNVKENLGIYRTYATVNLSKVSEQVKTLKNSEICTIER